MLEINKIYHTDCLEKLKEIPDNSVDAIITDPPYDLTSTFKRYKDSTMEKENHKRKELEEGGSKGVFARSVVGFMGKSWDGTGIAFKVETWKEAFRVLKPGGYLLSFGGTRTYHRMACAIEDAGFEIRDMIEWVYGSGFPKSLNIAKKVDEIKGNKREVIGVSQNEKDFRDVGKKVKEVIGIDKLSFGTIENAERKDLEITKGTSEWEGWGTALKPSHEPIVLARKPLSEKSVALNVLKWGTGGININECRISINDEKIPRMNIPYERKGDNNFGGGQDKRQGTITGFISQGRFPANLIHDSSEEVIAEFENAGKCGAFAKVNSGQKGFGGVIYGKYKTGGDDGATFYGDGLGTPSRFFKTCEFTEEDYPPFFYTAKASKSERNFGCEELPNQRAGGMQGRNDGSFDGRITYNNNNNHPTVKPIKLMEYLIKLVTPKDGIVLDPFIGSGTTACACIKLNRKFIGIEKEQEYVKIAEARIKKYLEQTKLDVK